jgi:hypothetical protein
VAVGCAGAGLHIVMGVDGEVAGDVGEAGYGGGIDEFRVPSSEFGVRSSEFRGSEFRGSEFRGSEF